MLLRKLIISVFIISLISPASVAQHKALSKINKKDLKRHLSFLASDELQGRMLGTEVDGLGIAADYIAEQAKKVGLQPGTDNYFQKVPMVFTRPHESNFISVLDNDGELLIRTNHIISYSGGSKTRVVESQQVVLVGFGDAELPELNGKIAIVAQGSKASFNESSSFRWNSRLEREKIKTISAKNPEAIVVVTNPKDKENGTFSQINAWLSRERYSLGMDAEEKEVPVLLSIPEFADHLLGDNGSYLNYLNNLEENKKSNCALEDKKVKFRIGNRTSDVDAKNIIGIVEGSDPQLKDEYVVFMAHYDHMGVSQEGEVYNGADDNGSGTVAILEVAEAFASMETKPQRSIVFLWVTCEEVGLLGSEYYGNNPVYPLEKTVLSVNLDMVGRVYESPRDDVYKDSPKRVKDFDGLYTLSNDVWPQLAEINAEKCRELGIVPDTSLPKERFLRSSDHYHFHKNGVPVLNYATGYHADYHKVGDEIEKINFNKIKRVAELCFLLGLEVANSEEIEF